MKKTLLALLILSGCASTTSAPVVEDNTPKEEQYIPASIHVELGVPKDSDSTDDYMIKRPQYWLSYNPQLNVANWVSWNENADWYGDEPRCDCFTKDPLLPSEFASVTTSDYTNSGYSRGHVLGSEARTKTAEDNRTTFYMSNIIPQTSELNSGTYNTFERFRDSLCKQANKELYVIAGGVYITKNKIKDKITIPDSCYMIVVVLDKGQKLKDVSNTTTIYAAMMHNGKYTKDNNDWRLYKRSVDDIERTTGYDFLSGISDPIESVVESKVGR